MDVGEKCELERDKCKSGFQCYAKEIGFTKSKPKCPKVKATQYAKRTLDKMKKRLQMRHLKRERVSEV